MATTADPRPLPDEPLALDLLNTVRMVDGAPDDLLATNEGLAAWLGALGLSVKPRGLVRSVLVETRDAIRGFLTDPSDRWARKTLNTVLGRGSLRVTLGSEGRPMRSVWVDDAAYQPAVFAAYNLVDLLDASPERIRTCEHPNCILWFLDTSRNGTRRWCSMARCGNRAKAQRHYSRSHTEGEAYGSI
jgi:predicted RNA-binding Zn ribbon-like protein